MRCHSRSQRSLELPRAGAYADWHRLARARYLDVRSGCGTPTVIETFSETVSIQNQLQEIHQKSEGRARRHRRHRRRHLRRADGRSQDLCSFQRRRAAVQPLRGEAGASAVIARPRAVARLPHYRRPAGTGRIAAAGTFTGSCVPGTGRATPPLFTTMGDCSAFCSSIHENPGYFSERGHAASICSTRILSPC